MSKEQAIEKVLEGFDFHQVRTAMLRMRWKWFIDGNHSVPTVDELKEKARYLLDLCYCHSGKVVMSSGGLVARCDKFSLSLSFEVVDSSSVDVDREAERTVQSNG